MKKNQLCFLVLSTFYFGILFSQNDIHNKIPNTLVDFPEIIDYYSKIDSKDRTNTDITVNNYTNTFGYLSLVTGTQNSRKIAQKKLHWLDLLFKSIKVNYKASDLFENEVLIKTKDKKYWLPIQKELYTFWEKEIEKDTKTLIRIRAFGSLNDIEENKWLFTINSFNTNYYDGLWEEALESFNNSDKENGFRCVQKLIKLNPKDGRNYAMLGFYYYDKGYPNNEILLWKADSLYSISEKLSPKYSYGYYQKALVKFQLCHYMEAWEAIDKARSLGEQNVEDFIIERFEKKFPYSKYLKNKK